MLTSNEALLARGIDLAPNFTLHELLRSTHYPEYVIYPYPDVLELLKTFAVEGLQPIRDEFGVTHVTSGWRNPILNSKVGGVDDSIHKIFHEGLFIGVASDILPGDRNVPVEEIATFIKYRQTYLNRVIVYRDTRRFGVSRPRLHVDMSAQVPAGDIIVMEALANGSYGTFPASELRDIAVYKGYIPATL